MIPRIGWVVFILAALASGLISLASGTRIYRWEMAVSEVTIAGLTLMLWGCIWLLDDRSDR
jgi:hypothetical protein